MRARARSRSPGLDVLNVMYTVQILRAYRMEHLPTFRRLANRKPADPPERFPNASSADVPAYRYRYAKRISARKCANKLQNRFALGAEKPIG
jgi:hypothetical protein